MNLQEIEEELQKLNEQCKAYLVILPRDNTQALRIVEQFRAQVDLLLEGITIRENQKFSHEILTSRESQTLVLLSEGHASKEIAYQLKISPKTVQFHIKNIFTKLDVGSRTEAVTTAIKKGLISI
jgi:DNA-binding NarL/FixJ family response regulator